MNVDGLKTFFCSNIRSVATYSAPAWFPLLSEYDKNRLEKVQRAATRAMLPGVEYTDRLRSLGIPPLCDFIMNLCERHFNRIVNNSDHPLFSRVVFNVNRVSSRSSAVFYPMRTRTKKRAKSFFPFFMSKLNK